MIAFSTPKYHATPTPKAQSGLRTPRCSREDLGPGFKIAPAADQGEDGSAGPSLPPTAVVRRVWLSATELGIEYPSDPMDPMERPET